MLPSLQVNDPMSMSWSRSSILDLLCELGILLKLLSVGWVAQTCNWQVPFGEAELRVTAGTWHLPLAGFVRLSETSTG